MCTGQGPPRPRAAGCGPGAQEPDCTWQQPVQAEPCPRALSPRPGRVLSVSFVPAEGGASAPVGAGVRHQVLPVIRSRSTVVATEQLLSTRGWPAGCVAECLCCGRRGLDPRERPRPSPLIVRGAVQEGALCQVAAPGSASGLLPASGSSAPPGPRTGTSSLLEDCEDHGSPLCCSPYSCPCPPPSLGGAGLQYTPFSFLVLKTLLGGDT